MQIFLQLLLAIILTWKFDKIFRYKLVTPASAETKVRKFLNLFKTS